MADERVCPECRRAMLDAADGPALRATIERRDDILREVAAMLGQDIREEIEKRVLRRWGVDLARLWRGEEGA